MCVCARVCVHMSIRLSTFLTTCVFVYVCKHQACFQQRILAFQSWQSSQTSLLKKRDEETRLLVAKTLKREKVDYCREEISRVSSSAASALCVGVYGRGGACVGGGGVGNGYNQPCDNNLEYSNNTHPIFRPSYHLTAYFQPYEWRPFFSRARPGVVICTLDCIERLHHQSLT